MTDEQLFVRYREGDAAGLEALVKRYEGPLYNHLCRYLRDSHRAEDVFQETFLRLARSAKDYDEKQPFRPWLYTIASNIARDVLRKEKVRKALSLDGLAAGHWAGAADADRPQRGAMTETTQPIEAAVKAEQAEALHEGLERLTPDFQEVVRLHFFGGLKYREVAQELAIPLGTVKSRIHAAIRQLESYWIERFGDDGEARELCPTTTATAS